MTAKTSGRFDKRLIGIAALALVLGIAVGVGVLYVTEGRSGNAVASNCPLDKKFADAVDQNAKGEVAAVHALATPFDMKAIAFKDADGKDTTLTDLTGKTLLVNLWATWCVPCRAEMPALDTLQAEAGGQGFSVIPINVDNGSDAKPKKFYAETKLKSLPFYHDGTLAAFDTLKSQGIAFGLPVSLLVGPDGCARAAITGPAEWASPDALRLIKAVMSSVGDKAARNKAARSPAGETGFAPPSRGA
ncbi:TlpA family protein disulfide reductase [Jiella sp. MQZ9-1]|uniref:TlpA family protein disulfide reductase n=1 Tax=Jiella flava TaxID=2816857 RepID=A0A939G2E1_9HYPH|nr:TlpA disulfide reductase family protein [Jiella flava]MBO0664466.1 TlpA family protein disulfide reductase [Jiella flava]MCD2473102.1 TlpA family protein disulfide reductase [Jiella flava]